MGAREEPIVSGEKLLVLSAVMGLLGLELGFIKDNPERKLLRSWALLAMPWIKLDIRIQSEI